MVPAWQTGRLCGDPKRINKLSNSEAMGLASLQYSSSTPQNAHTLRDSAEHWFAQDDEV